MLQQVPLQAIPNQSLSLVLDNNQWDITVKFTGGVTTVSLALNGEDVMDSALAAAGALIIPTLYQEQNSGNFFFVTSQFQMPNYSQFGITQFFLYASASDLAAVRQPVAAPITALDFNPIAPLSLRFAPQGYVEA